MSTIKPHHTPKMPRELLQTVGRFLAQGRKSLNWRQIDLAERLGVSRYTVTRLEQGDPRVAAGVYFTAAWLLDVPIITGMEPRSSNLLANFIKALDEMQVKRIHVPKKGAPDNNF